MLFNIRVEQNYELKNWLPFGMNLNGTGDIIHDKVFTELQLTQSNINSLTQECLRSNYAYLYPDR